MPRRNGPSKEFGLCPRYGLCPNVYGPSPNHGRSPYQMQVAPAGQSPASHPAAKPLPRNAFNGFSGKAEFKL
jgi:hypothetical protein